MEQFLDQIYVIAEEMRQDKGEDSFFADWNGSVAVAAVMDGCGGLGTKRYPCFRNHSGAYVGARVVSGAVQQWFQRESSARQWKSGAQLAESLDRYIRAGFRLCAARITGDGGAQVIGSMVRPLPCTLAFAALQPGKGGVNLFVVWGGDSRVYLLDEQGLAQITRDDVEGSAMENLTADGALLNVLSSDGNYQLHAAQLTLRRPALVFAATDGCFGYLQTPMEFEHCLLHALTQSKTPKEFEETLKGYFRQAAGDDFTCAMVSVGFQDFARTQKRLLPRYEQVAAEYIEPLYAAYDTQQRETIQETQLRLWQTYRNHYERILVVPGNEGKG